MLSLSGLSLSGFKSRFFSNIQGDIFGGLTAGIVALPLALGFGVASGIEGGAAVGLYGAIIIGALASIFGGTSSQISGPTGPMTVVVAGLVATFQGNVSIEWVFMMVVLSGLFQVAFGLLRIGRYINYMPYPVLSGFMSGIGVIIIILQIAQLVGHAPQSGVVAAVQQIPVFLSSVHYDALGLGLATMAIIYGFPRITQKVPSTLVALVVVSLASVVLSLDVTRIGAIPSTLPSLQIPHWDPSLFKAILVPALMLAVVGSIDSLLTSLVADNITKTKHDSERELVGQGIGNVVAGFFGGLPGAGATMRTVVNVKAGGRSPLSGVVHAILLLMTLLLLGPLASEIPLAVLAGILITVGIGIIDVKGLRCLAKVPRGDAMVLVVTLLLTVFVDLMWAVAAGLVLSSLILSKRLADMDPAIHSPLRDIAAHRSWIPALDESEKILGDVHLVEIKGSLFFGNAGPLQRELGGLEAAEAVVVDLSAVPFLDQSGAFALSDVIKDLKKQRVDVFLCEMQEEPARVLAKLGVAPGEVDAAHIVSSVEKATEMAVSLHPSKVNEGERSQQTDEAQ
ncbi:MAG: SulP family inorganic anion transporter [Deltaproteobacteria bacterium]|nr:SulP family inorganic anion transporter [Deltaproteobacteria bacterium]